MTRNEVEKWQEREAELQEELRDAQASIRKHQAAGLRMVHELNRLTDKLTNLRTAAERFAWSEDRDTQDLLDAIKASTL